MHYSRYQVNCRNRSRKKIGEKKPFHVTKSTPETNLRNQNGEEAPSMSQSRVVRQVKVPSEKQSLRYNVPFHWYTIFRRRCDNSLGQALQGHQSCSVMI